jgi:hypothetical protein
MAVKQGGKIDLGSVVGPQGPRGEAGPAGPAGPAGAKGDKGDTPKFRFTVEGGHLYMEELTE